MQAIANDLHESWLDGYLSHVIREVVRQPSGAQSALLGALLFSAMSQADRIVFLRMLKDKVNE